MYIHSSLRMVQSALCCNAFRSCLSFGHGACRTFPSVTGSEAELAINSLNAELNPIRHLLALVGARHIVHVSRIRVKGKQNTWTRPLGCVRLTENTGSESLTHTHTHKRTHKSNEYCVLWVCLYS